MQPCVPESTRVGPDEEGAAAADETTGASYVTAGSSSWQGAGEDVSEMPASDPPLLTDFPLSREEEAALDDARRQIDSVDFGRAELNLAYSQKVEAEVLVAAAAAKKARAKAAAPTRVSGDDFVRFRAEPPAPTGGGLKADAEAATSKRIQVVDEAKVVTEAPPSIGQRVLWWSNKMVQAFAAGWSSFVVASVGAASGEKAHDDGDTRSSAAVEKAAQAVVDAAETMLGSGSAAEGVANASGDTPAVEAIKPPQEQSSAAWTLSSKSPPTLSLHPADPMPELVATHGASQSGAQSEAAAARGNAATAPTVNTSRPFASDDEAMRGYLHESGSDAHHHLLNVHIDQRPPWANANSSPVLAATRRPYSDGRPLGTDTLRGAMSLSASGVLPTAHLAPAPFHQLSVPTSAHFTSFSATHARLAPLHTNRSSLFEELKATSTQHTMALYGEGGGRPAGKRVDGRSETREATALPVYGPLDAARQAFRERA